MQNQCIMDVLLKMNWTMADAICMSTVRLVLAETGQQTLAHLRRRAASFHTHDNSKTIASYVYKLLTALTAREHRFCLCSNVCTYRADKDVHLRMVKIKLLITS